MYSLFSVSLFSFKKSRKSKVKGEKLLDPEQSLGSKQKGKRTPLREDTVVLDKGFKEAKDVGPRSFCSATNAAGATMVTANGLNGWFGSDPMVKNHSQITRPPKRALSSDVFSSALSTVVAAMASKDLCGKQRGPFWNQNTPAGSMHDKSQSA